MNVYSCYGNVKLRSEKLIYCNVFRLSLGKMVKFIFYFVVFGFFMFFYIN